MADLFDKIATDQSMQLVRMGKETGVYPYFRPLSETEGTEVVINGHRLIMIGSNNYLGLTTHPKVREAAIEATRQYGTSCTGSRFLNGSLELHEELERRLAKFIGKEAAIVFSTGYQSNLGAISALMDKEDVAICDKDVHASLVDAVKMAGCQMKRYRHNDMDDLERVLKQTGDAPKMVIVDGVYSMGGDLARVPEIAALCKRYGARFFVDDAHGLGVMGPGGRGTPMHFGVVDQVDLVMGTFSKSFASLGGVIAGDRDVIDFIQHHARPFIFSASMPPANAAAVLACVDILEADPSYPSRVLRLADKVRAALGGMGYNCGESVTPIIPVFIGSEMNTVFAWRAFFDYGIYTNPVLPPGVPPNKSLLRTSYMATHTDEQIDRIIQGFYDVGVRVGLIEEKDTVAT